MLKILYKRYYREVYILYLLFCILCGFLLWDFRNGNKVEILIFSAFYSTSILSVALIPMLFFPESIYRDSYGQKACKNHCIVVERGYYTTTHKCEHCEYCPHSVHKYQHKVFKHMRILKNKFLGW